MPPSQVNGDGEALKGECRVDGIPKKMKALQYSAPEKFAVVKIDVPEIRDDEVLVKITACGVCGTDLHYHKGEFLAKFPLIPGHEATGTIAAHGRSVTHLPLDTPVTIDPLLPCDSCTHCSTRRPLLCTSLTAYGGNQPGGFAEYCAYPASLVHALPPTTTGTSSSSTRPLTPLEAVLIEPASCALHGIERMSLSPGDRVLLFGCGPTGLLLAQLVRQNGAAHLTIASKPGPKLDLARKMGVGDSYLSVSEDPTTAASQLEELAQAEPDGFNIVIEATGSPAVLERSIDYVRKGGKLVVYGVYAPEVKISWSPFTIWEREITVLASFCSMRHTPQVLEYIRSGRLRLEGVVDRVFRVEEWEEAMGVVGRGECVKGAIVFE